MAGRKAIPNALKKVRGTDQPVRMREELSVNPLTEPITKLPKDSPLKTARAKKIFIEKANQLIALGVLTSLDLESLSLYASTLDTVYTCLAELKKGPEFERVKDKNGVIKYVPNPYRQLLHNSIEIVNKIGGDFGFTPVSRQRISVKPPEEKNALEEFLKID